MNFADSLTQRIAKLSNPSVVGLDPRLDQIPDFIREEAMSEYDDPIWVASESIITFNMGIIDAIADIVPAVKPQLAFYECFGSAGIEAYEETVAYAKKKGLLVIGDGKRNDIGSTAEAYAKAHLSEEIELLGSKAENPMAVHALTVTPYLGSDGILPFTKICMEEGKGIFVLVRTSNPSADEIQGQPLGDHLMDEHVANLVEGWGRELVGESGFSSVGAVIGATYPEEARRLRQLMPSQIFLVPGYGAQGGNADDVKACFYENGTGAIVNSSRGILYAYQKNNQPGEAYAEAAREATLQMKEELNRLF